MVRAPERCPHGHRLMPGRMLLGSIACSVNAFKTHLPDVTTVNLVTEKG